MLSPSIVTGLARIPWIGPRVVFRLHQRGIGFDRLDWAGFADLVIEQRPPEVSLDVFDTCLVRDLGGHDAVEQVIAHRRRFDRSDDVLDAGLDPVGVDQRDVAAWDDPGMERIIANDVAAKVEFELCRPVPGAVAGLAAIRSVGSKVTFVSDTERSSESLVALLRHHRLFEDGDRLVASGEVGATKSGGGLFPRIWARSEAGTVWHAGNQVWADGAMPAAAGLRPVHLAEADLTRYESIPADGPRGEGPAVASAARRARLDITEELRAGRLSSHRADVQILGADVAGQALVAFDLWLVEQARRFDLDALSFLARDGELPLRIALAMPADHWNGLTLGYLHCSRMIWGLASASVVGVDRWLAAGQADDGAFLVTQRHAVPLSILLDRIGLEQVDVERLGSVHQGLARSLGDRPLTPEQVDDWHRLLADDRVAELIEERSERRRLLLVDYLADRNLLDGRRVGLVDVGWRGRLGWHISAVFRSAGSPEPVHLHFGGDKVIPEVDRAITISRFAFQGTEPDDLMTQTRVSCVETLTASGKERVVEYRRDDDGRVVPVFGPSGHGGATPLSAETPPADHAPGIRLVTADLPGEAPVAPSWTHHERAQLWEGALRVAQHLPSRKQLVQWGIDPTDLGPAVQDLLRKWWLDPEPGEVKALAGLLFEHDEAGTSFRPMAKPYTWREVARGAGSDRAWVRGSEALTPPFTRALVVLGRSVKYRLMGRRS